MVPFVLGLNFTFFVWVRKCGYYEFNTGENKILTKAKIVASESSGS